METCRSRGTHFKLCVCVCVCVFSYGPVPPPLPFHESYPHGIIVLALNRSQHCFYISQVLYGGKVETILSAETLSLSPGFHEDREHSAVGEKPWRYISTENTINILKLYSITLLYFKSHLNYDLN